MNDIAVTHRCSDLASCIDTPGLVQMPHATNDTCPWKLVGNGDYLQVAVVAANGKHLQVAMIVLVAEARGVATICKPLHYEIIINRRALIQMAASAWAAGVMYSALHTGNTFSLPFCHSNIINQFFCEVPQLLKLSCSDTYRRELAAIVLSIFLALCCFAFIVVSYVQIFTAVWRIPSEQGRQKAFSTCIPHLTVVYLFLSTSSIAYMKPVSDSPSPLDLLAAVLYSVVPPLMNPVIYSMRNKEIQAALRKLLHRLIRSKNSLSIFLS
ncbi:olfactory receptor 14C36-like [Alligator mississippiensis]|uniref:olfactory receptor 14C36-like n=1 Tax=Alligator mississippiensis TaxID=8496 RepID=UPI0028777DFF|nr:olfactory receptor 14C36-like [Alligator mississippiensis]